MEPRKRKNGYWYARIGGRRVSLGLPKSASLAQARRRAAQLLIEGASPTLPDEEMGPVMLSGLWQLFMDVRGAGKAPGSVMAWRYRYRYVKRVWGDRDCRGITPLDCERLRAGLLGPFSASTVASTISTLKAVFKFGVLHGFLERNPAAELKAPKPRTDSWDWYTLEESALFLAAARRVAPHYAPLLELALLTGLRLSEITGLKWEQVDLNSGSLRLVGKGNKIAVLPLSSRALALLKTQRAATLMVGARVFRAKTSGNHAINSATLRDVMRRVASAAGLRRIRFHDLRHSFVSQLINNGVDIKTASELARHASIRTTASVYGHLLLSTKRDALEVLVSPEQSTKTTQAG